MVPHIGDSGRVNDIHVAMHHIMDSHAVEVVVIDGDIGHVPEFLELYRVNEVICVAFARSWFSGSIGFDLFEAILGG